MRLTSVSLDSFSLNEDNSQYFPLLSIFWDSLSYHLFDFHEQLGANFPCTWVPFCQLKKKRMDQETKDSTKQRCIIQIKRYGSTADNGTSQLTDSDANAEGCVVAAQPHIRFKWSFTE